MRRQGRQAYRTWRRTAPRRRWPLPVALLTLVLLATGAIALDFIPLDPLFRIRAVEIEIDGPGALTRDDVENALALEDVASLLALDWNAACRAVHALPRVRAVRISYAWIHRLRIEVEERTATALLLASDGRALEVGGDGITLAARGTSLADLPLLSCAGEMPRLRPGERLTLPGADALLRLLATLQCEYPSLRDGISEACLLADGSYELFWNDSPTVVWGCGDLSPMRLRAWTGVMTDLERRGETDAVVDLRFREQILVRFPEGSASGVGSMS